MDRALKLPCSLGRIDRYIYYDLDVNKSKAILSVSSILNPISLPIFSARANSNRLSFVIPYRGMSLQTRSLLSVQTRSLLSVQTGFDFVRILWALFSNVVGDTLASKRRSTSLDSSLPIWYAVLPSAKPASTCCSMYNWQASALNCLSTMDSPLLINLRTFVRIITNISTKSGLSTPTGQFSAYVELTIGRYI